MKAIILAAGRGERMRPLTDHTPKPLLQVGGHALIEWHLHKLAAAGIVDVVINHAWLGEQLEAKLGDGARYGVTIQYSAESQALETAGGIKKALSLLGSDTFLVLNGDVYTDWTPTRATETAQQLNGHDKLAHLVVVPNPSHHAQGDFYFDPLSHQLHTQPTSASLQRYTYSGIGYYHPTFFEQVATNAAVPLGPLLREHIDAGHLSAELYDGLWTDVGTPERLQELTLQLGYSL